MCFFPRRLWLCWMSRVSPRNMISFTCPSTSKIPAASATLSSTWFARALSWVGRPTFARISSKTNNTYQDMRITIIECIEYQQVSLFRSYFSIGGMVPHSTFFQILQDSFQQLILCDVGSLYYGTLISTNHQRLLRSSTSRPWWCFGTQGEARRLQGLESN